jgi:hypothetical protein
MLRRISDYEPQWQSGRGEKRPAQDAAPQPAASDGEEELWLLGQPPLKRYLDFVEAHVVDGATADRAALAAEWRAANEYYQELERREAGIANQAERRDLDPAMAEPLAQLQAHPRFRRSFDTLTNSFAMVELDRLIVFQKHVSRNFVDALAARIGPAPEPAALFGFCLPLGARDCPVQMRREGSRRYVFRCESTDFRYLESKLLRPEEVAGLEALGPVAGIVGLVIGFGSNFLHAVSIGRRLMLNNGYHRACALRAAGITHAPCLIQTAGTVDELELVDKSDVMDDPQFYFESARPPLLRDFFDPRIRKLLPVRRRRRVIEVNFEINDFMVDE